MKRKIFIGILFGIAAGIIDVIPMIVRNLSWDANVSAFALWVVTGFLISVTDLRITSVMKGVPVSFLVLLPCAVLIGRKEPISVLSIAVMTCILGGALGYAIDKKAPEKN